MINENYIPFALVQSRLHFGFTADLLVRDIETSALQNLYQEPRVRFRIFHDQYPK
jgi:hypothetical protein